MVLKRSKIAIMICGGSTLRIEGRKSFAVEKPTDVKIWMEYLREAKIIADLKPFFLYGNRQAESLDLKGWQRLADAIYQQYQNFDGFIVTHFLETINLPATALSFIFPNLGKPIIFTGSFAAQNLQDWQTMGFKSSELYQHFNFRSNFVNALQASNLDLAEVAVIIGNRLLRANQLQIGQFFRERAKRQGVLGQVDFGVELLAYHQKRHDQKLIYQPDFNQHIAIWEQQPWNQELFLKQSLKIGIQGLMIKSPQVKRQIQNMKSALRLLDQKKVLVVFPQAKPKIKISLPPNVVFCDRLTPNTLQIKLMWVLAQKNNLREQKKLLLTNISGEFIE